MSSPSSNGKLNKTIYYYSSHKSLNWFSSNSNDNLIDFFLHMNHNISTLHLYFDYSTTTTHHVKIQKCKLTREHLCFILDEGVKHYIIHHIFLHLIRFVILAIKIFQMHLKGLLLKFGVILVIVQLNNVDLVHGIHMDLFMFILLWP